MGFVFDFLTRYTEAGDEFIDHIVTSGGTWIYRYTSEIIVHGMEKYSSHKSIEIQNKN